MQPDSGKKYAGGAIGAADWNDLSRIWLPYAQMKTAGAPLPVAGTRGSRVILADGSELTDGIASWWTACHGYNHPHISAAVKRQLDIMPHVMFAGLVHEGALTLVEHALGHPRIGECGMIAEAEIVVARKRHQAPPIALDHDVAARGGHHHPAQMPALEVGELGHRKVVEG
jgi:hypothetical protein